MVVALVGTVLKGGLVIANNVLVARLANLATFDLRKLFYRRTLRLDLATFNDEGSSDLMSRFTHDTSNIGNGLETVFGKLVLEPLKMIACLVGAAWVCWRLLLLSLIVAPAAALAIRWLSKMLKRANRRAMEQMVQIFNVLEETFRGIKIVKAFTSEPYERRRFHLRSKEYYRKAMKIARYDSLSHPITEFMGILTVCLALLGRDVAGAQGRNPAAGHPADLAAAGPQLALALLWFPLRHGRSGAKVLRHLQPAAMRRGGQRPDLRPPGPRAGHSQPEESRALPAASARAGVRRRVVRVSARHAGLGRRDAADSLRRDDRDRRSQRLRQVDAGQFDPAFCRPGRGPHPPGRRAADRPQACATFAGRSAW